MKTNIPKIHEKLNNRKKILDKVAEAGIQIAQFISKNLFAGCGYTRERIRKRIKRVDLWK
jgi:hypothetical protein